MSREWIEGRLEAIQFALRVGKHQEGAMGRVEGRTELLNGPDESDLRRCTSTCLDLLDYIVQYASDMGNTRSSTDEEDSSVVPHDRSLAIRTFDRDGEFDSLLARRRTVGYDLGGE